MVTCPLRLQLIYTLLSSSHTPLMSYLTPVFVVLTIWMALGLSSELLIGLCMKERGRQSLYSELAIEKTVMLKVSKSSVLDISHCFLVCPVTQARWAEPSSKHVNISPFTWWTSATGTAFTKAKSFQWFHVFVSFVQHQVDVFHDYTRWYEVVHNDSRIVPFSTEVLGFRKNLALPCTFSYGWWIDRIELNNGQKPCKGPSKTLW